jgi:Kef-type K+ transport system membrane component KefB
MPVPVIEKHSLLLLLLQVSVLLFLALILGTIARRYKLPSVVGELSAGVILGPSILGNLAPGVFQWLFPPQTAQFHMLDAIGQLGVILLVGLSGMELNLSLLKRYTGDAFRISLLGLVIPFMFGFGAAYFIPDSLIPSGIDRLLFALFLGVALCVSAIPVIAKTLMDLGLMNHRIGHLALTAGMIDDVIGWTILSVVAVMATTGGVHPGQIGRSILYVILVLAFALTIGRFIIHKILDWLQNDTDNGPLVTAIASLILLSAAITHAMGLEAVFGAFICGIIICSDPRYKKLYLPTVLSVLAPLFFATAGLRIDLSPLINPTILGAALLVLAAAMAGKFLGVYIGGRWSRLGSRESLALGAAMNARGVIEIIIASVGLRLGILSPAVYTIIVLVAVVTSLTAPPILRHLIKNRE